ncbi:unnamed protein product [Symbiodinium natans]|uniref:Uncharacterized protein n=1 Tax=Symbiodinium natans TaxID=878477 RepID=A0A812N3W3_9DINO|nr:unnamed protein product [Symbiodinium natans]
MDLYPEFLLPVALRNNIFVNVVQLKLASFLQPERPQEEPATGPATEPATENKKRGRGRPRKDAPKPPCTEPRGRKSAEDQIRNLQADPRAVCCPVGKFGDLVKDILQDTIKEAKLPMNVARCSNQDLVEGTWVQLVTHRFTEDGFSPGVMVLITRGLREGLYEVDFCPSLPLGAGQKGCATPEDVRHAPRTAE